MDNKLIFDSHILYIYLKAKENKCFKKRKKLKNISTGKIPFKSTFEAQFKYCPLIWMSCSRSANSKINKLHERSLRISDDSNSKFEDFLTTDSSFIIHHQNIQTLEIEMFKINQGFSQISFLDENNCYSLRSQQTFKFQELILLWKEQSAYDVLDP